MPTDIPSTAAQSPTGCVMPAFVVLFAVGVLAVTFLGSTCVRGGGDSGAFEAPLARFAPDDPVYVSTKGLYIVRLASGEVIALDQNESRREDVINGCLIRYRETARAGGRTGLFRGDCTGTLYDLSGMPVEGASPPMKHHPVTVEGATIKVDVKACLDGKDGSPTPCKPT